METYSAHLYIPLIGAVLYTVLLLTPHIRRGQDKKQTRWLLITIILAIVWEFSIYFSAQLTFPNLPLIALLLNTCAVGGITAAYLHWKPARAILGLLAAAILSVTLVNWLTPVRVFVLPDGRYLTSANGDIIAYTAWFAFSGLILGKTWREYQNTELPWHANRLLYWFMALLTLFAGEILQFIDNPGFIVIGQALRYIGIVGLAYGVASYRIMDVRTRARHTIAFLIINFVSAAPLIGAILLILNFSGDLDRYNKNLSLLLIAVVVALGFLFYDPYRRFIERITFRYLGGEGLNSNLIIRNYSQAIARTLDVQQLSVLIAGTLNEMLETNRCALLPVSRQDDGCYAIENPIVGMGQIPKKEIIFPPKDRFIALLSTEHQPLLQYDIDFNPVYSDINEAHGDWLSGMGMEVYVPINDGDEIAGIIAVGPKGTGLPYQSNELELMQTLADQTIVALQNARLYSVLNAQNEQVRLLNEDLVDQNEKLEIMDRVKTDFITIASHELRTPLTQVKGYADILAAMNEENALSREQTREIVGHINRATLQLEGLITDMLETSQLDVDEMRLTFVKTRLQSIIKLAMEPLIQALRERRITLTQEGVDELPPIYADYKRLVQAFTKLLGNAVKYTPDGGRITVTAALIPSVDGEEQYFEVIIQDSGIGIDPKFHELIFEKFFRIGDPQLHSTGSTKFKGAGPGLGLPIAKGVIEGHHGRIWVESEGEDEQRMPGSAFHIILPVKPPEAETAPASQPEKEARPSYLIG